MQVRTATWQLAQELGRMPTESDLAAPWGSAAMICGMPGWLRWRFSRPRWTPRCPVQPGTALLADLLGGEDPQLEHMLDMQAVATHWGELPPHEQKILLMRFYGSMTQDQIGQQLGLSQMQVSRLLGHALGYLRPRLLGLDEATAR